MPFVNKEVPKELRKLEKQERHLEREEHHELNQLDRIERKLDKILCNLSKPTPHFSGTTKVFSNLGEINMSQTLLTSFPGSDILTFQTFDNSNPPQDITTRCKYAVTSDAPAVTVGPVNNNSVPVVFALGKANVKIVTTDSGGDTIQDVNLLATISPVPAGTTTVTAQSPNTSIS